MYLFFFGFRKLFTLNLAFLYHKETYFHYTSGGFLMKCFEIFLKWYISNSLFRPRESHSTEKNFQTGIQQNLCDFYVFPSIINLFFRILQQRFCFWNAASEMPSNIWWVAILILTWEHKAILWDLFWFLLNWHGNTIGKVFSFGDMWISDKHKISFSRKSLSLVISLTLPKQTISLQIV